MNQNLISFIRQTNPWLQGGGLKSYLGNNLISRVQFETLLSATWDRLWTILIGPRRAGKTTLGFQLSQYLLELKRFDGLIYLNCDERLVREWLVNTLFLEDIFELTGYEKPIVFIDEVQRLTSPGLLLKSVADLKCPIKMIATGSSQLEIKSKVQENLTGRQIETLVLPFSSQELQAWDDNILIYGCYPEITQAKDVKEKLILLRQLYIDYISKDIVGFLKVGQPDTMEKLITLVAHASGQLINYTALSKDCQASIGLVKNYLALLEKTYAIARVTPFVGNKRKEITSNPIYYFLDNGLRNEALKNYLDLDARQDTGLLVEGAVFQELLKFKAQHFLNYDIHFWRTQSGAEVDFVLYINSENIIPIEVKYRNMNEATLSKSFHSFLDAYEPKLGFFITKDFYKVVYIKGCHVHFFPFGDIQRMLEVLKRVVG